MPAANFTLVVLQEKEMKKFTKKQRKQLRELASKSYAAELASNLNSLHEQFSEWKAGKITVWDLEDIIHKFHDGKARDLFKFYEYGDQYDMHVAHGVRHGYVEMDEIEESCREFINGWLDHPSRFEEDEEDENEEEAGRKRCRTKR